MVSPAVEYESSSGQARASNTRRTLHGAVSRARLQRAAPTTLPCDTVVRNGMHRKQRWSEALRWAQRRRERAPR